MSGSQGQNVYGSGSQGGGGVVTGQTSTVYSSGVQSGASGGQVSSGQYGTGQVSGGQYGSQVGGAGQGGTYTYNRTWSSGVSGEGLSEAEREAIRKNLQTIARPNYQGSGRDLNQGVYNQGHVTYTQGGQSNYGQGSQVQGSYGQAQGGYAQGNYNQGGYYQGNAQSGQGYVQGQATGGAGEYGKDGRIVRVKNRTILYDENNNIISQTETSTEYGSLGHEGEAGSSFNT